MCQQYLNLAVLSASCGRYAHRAESSSMAVKDKLAPIAQRELILEGKERAVTQTCCQAG